MRVNKEMGGLPLVEAPRIASRNEQFAGLQGRPVRFLSGFGSLWDRASSRLSAFLVVAALSLVVVSVQAAHRYGRVTSDSHQYMSAALTYQKEGRIEFEPWREYGYPAAILALSRLVPWKTSAELAKWVTALQIAAYLILFAGLVAVAVK